MTRDELIDLFVAFIRLKHGWLIWTLDSLAPTFDAERCRRDVMEFVMQLSRRGPAMMTTAEVWARLPRWKRVWLTALDVWANQHLFGGSPETISERLAKARDRGEQAGIIGCQMLDAVDPGHCDRALRYPTGERR